MKPLQDLVFDHDLEVACAKLDDDVFNEIDELQKKYRVLRGQVIANRDKGLEFPNKSEEVSVEKKRLMEQFINVCNELENIIRDKFSYLFDISSKTFEQQVRHTLKDRYDVGKAVINGNSAVFYTGYERNSQRKVMIRALKKYDFSSFDLKASNQKEQNESARLLKIINFKHRNIVKILGTDFDSFPKCLILEYIDGISLDAMLKVLPLTKSNAVEMAIQLTEAVNYLHTHREIHRRIRPSSILIDNELQPIISPYEMLDGVYSVQNSKTFKEDLYYKAPEIFSEKFPEGDEKSDQFSLGATFYDLVTGKHLFGTSTKDLQSIFQKRRDFFTKKKVRKEMLAKITDAKLRGIMDKMLAEDPKDRYFSMAEVLKELRMVPVYHNLEFDRALDSYRRCCIHNPDFFSEFYTNLFAHPTLGTQIKHIFHAHSVDEDDRSLQRKLRNALLLLLNNIEDLDVFRKIIKLNGHHQVKMEYYEAFMDTLIDTVKEDDYLWKKYEEVQDNALATAWQTVREKTLQGLKQVTSPEQKELKEVAEKKDTKNKK